ncbi:MAG TPA: hypothetical protein VH143_31630 [Kofleriaceae bacterium]|jgi:hypothetical protein|nr:hypothetical protein [Kofleriaceae bacterium]
MKSVVAVLAGALVACGTSNTGKPIANDKCERAFVRMLPVLQRITARNPRREIETCREAALHDPTREVWLDCILSIPSGHVSMETIEDCKGKDRQARGGASPSSPPSPSSGSASETSSSSEVSR